MAKRYILLELDDSGGGGGDNDDWAGVINFVIICAVIYCIYSALFGAYDDRDFQEAKYLKSCPRRCRAFGLGVAGT
ncbi:MAG: hypothetical protein IKN27_13275 [Selenomonadaceae bacterium]|nr:hypothetical protein [Selenomonadaceae bacterium]